MKTKDTWKRLGMDLAKSGEKLNPKLKHWFELSPMNFSILRSRACALRSADRKRKQAAKMLKDLGGK